MPELPDVEIRRRYVQKTSIGQPISRVRVTDAFVLGEGTTPASLGRGLKGSKLVAARRRGKYLLGPTDAGKTLLMHLGMTGDLFYVQEGAETPRFSRVELHFSSGGCLHYTNARKIGKVALFDTTDPRKIPDIAKLGPEPLSRSFTYENFRDLVKGHLTTIHQLLMDQELIAGIGNIYSDEIAYRAGVRPDRKTGSLTDAETRRLYEMTGWVLRRAIRLGADLDGHADEFLIPNRGRGGTCPGSDEKLVKKTIGGRSSYYCPSRQR